MIDYSVEPDRCIVVGITTPDITTAQTEEFLDELVFPQFLLDGTAKRAGTLD